MEGVGWSGGEDPVLLANEVASLLLSSLELGDTQVYEP